MKTREQIEGRLMRVLEFFAQDEYDNLVDDYGKAKIMYYSGQQDALEYALGYTITGDEVERNGKKGWLRIYPRNTFRHPYKCLVCQSLIPTFHGILKHERDTKHPDFKCLIRNADNK